MNDNIKPNSFEQEMSALDNPRAIVGSNNPPEPTTLRTADELLPYLTGHYEGLSAEATELLAEIRDQAPASVETEQDNGIIAAFMERLRSTIKTADHHREAEKAPYLKAERAAQQFFAGMTDRLTKARQILQKRGDDYTARKVAAERAERARLQREADAEARRAAEAEARKRAEAEAIEAAARRARNPERIEKLQDAAQIGNAAASVAAVDALIANSNAEAAAIAAAASSASIARTRHESGHLSTAKQVPFVAIEDVALLDLNVLRPYIKEDELLRALKAWARTTGHKRQMDGAIIEMRDAAEYR